MPCVPYSETASKTYHWADYRSSHDMSDKRIFPHPHYSFSRRYDRLGSTHYRTARHTDNESMRDTCLVHEHLRFALAQ